jgi:hypothetical protein
LRHDRSAATPDLARHRGGAGWKRSMPLRYSPRPRSHTPH